MTSPPVTPPAAPPAAADPSPPFGPGDVVRSPYGPVAVTSVWTLEEGTAAATTMLRGRLGRPAGRSLADAPQIVLRADAIEGPVLPATPGMITLATLSSSNAKEKVSVHCYSVDRDTYTVSSLPDPGTLVELSSTCVDMCPSTKFYPLLEDLLHRADSLGKSAGRNLLSAISGNSTAVTEVAEDVKEALQDETGLKAEDLTADSAGEFASRVVRATKRNLLPDGKEVAAGASELIAMLKDEEWTDLLHKSKDRLTTMISDDLPAVAERTLADAGIVISASAGADAASRALSAINGLLRTHAETDLEEASDTVTHQFRKAMDALRTTAEHDRRMGSIYDLLLEKSSGWQEATGMLLETAGAGTWIEGGKRLRARAANILSPQQMASFGSGISALTEGLSGEAAVARLKTLEVGEAVRDRLICAIEVKTGSAGGLDGMIAKALAGAGGVVSEEGAGSSVKSLVEMMSKNATKTGKDAQETLLVAVSRRSAYRDQVMTSIESGLVDLEQNLGNALSVNDITDIIRGDKGTASLFEPMARRASAEIERQLMAAEDGVKDNPHVMSALGYVRRLVSGELTGDAALQDIVTVLNDESVVAAGEGWIQKGDQVLDVLENAAGNETVGKVLSVVKDAGGWGDGTLVDAVEKLDVNEILKTAETAYTDAEVRRNLFLSATDSALDFLLRILPSMPVPPLDGVKDGVIYSLSNLGLQGFKVRKEKIYVEIAGIKAQKKKAAAKTPASPATWPHDTAPDAAPDANPDAAPSPDAADDLSVDSFATAESIKATELLIIDVRDIQANLDEALWSFEQTYFPKMKGSGTASVQLVDASVRLQFELRKRRVDEEEDTPLRGKVGGGDDDLWNDAAAVEDVVEGGERAKWEPVLCLCDCSCNIERVDLRLIGSGMTWLVNMLAALFRVFLKKYVIFTVEKTLRNSSGYILENLNSSLCGYWDLIMRTAKLNMDDLAILSESDTIKATDTTASYDVELVWREAVPLGIQLLMNDNSGYLKVVDFPRGGQARSVAEAASLNPDIFKGARITAVNGKRFELPAVVAESPAKGGSPSLLRTVVPQVLAALQVPERPKSITFALASSEDAERVRCFVEGVTFGEEKGDMPRPLSSTNMSVKNVEVLDEGPLGLVFASSLDDFGLEVESFSRGGENEDTILPVEKNGSVNIGDILVSVNGEIVLGENGNGRTKFLEIFGQVGSSRPLTLGFATGYLKEVEFHKEEGGYCEAGPVKEFAFKDKTLDSETQPSPPSSDCHRVVLEKYDSISSTLEIAGVLLGDHLVAVNGAPVGAALFTRKTSDTTYVDEILERLCDPEEYPMTLSFARPNADSAAKIATPDKASGIGRWGRLLGGAVASPRSGASIMLQNSRKFNVTVENRNHLGCIFGPSSSDEYEEVVVSSFTPVRGPAQLKMLSFDGDNFFAGMSVEAIDGVSVPSYINGEILAGTLQRSWEADGALKLLFCHDERKEWLFNLLT